MHQTRHGGVVIFAQRVGIFPHALHKFVANRNMGFAQRLFRVIPVKQRQIIRR